MFTVDQIGPNLYRIWFETEDVKLSVAEISRGRDWELHYTTGTQYLSANAKSLLTRCGLEQIAKIKITERLLK